MKGQYRVTIFNKRLRFEFDIRRNITVVRGDSATGKTTLIGMLSNYEQNGVASGITVNCTKKCVVLEAPENYIDSKAYISWERFFTDCMSLYSYAKVSSLFHATYIAGLKNCLIALYVIQRLAITDFVSFPAPHFQACS